MSFDLARLVGARLEAHLTDVGLKLPKPGSGELVTPAVYVGDLPGRDDVTEPAPCVVVLAPSGEDGQLDSDLDREEVEIGLACLIQTNMDDDRPMEAAHNIILNLTEACREALKDPTPIGEGWTLSYPLRWDIFDKATGQRRHPFYTSAISAMFERVKPRDRLSASDRNWVHGSTYP